MGIFSKLKSKMDGGLHVRVQAPSSVPSDQVIEVTITVTSDSSQTINSVKAELKAQVHESGLAMGHEGVGIQSGQTTSRTVAQAENRDQFTISPGESKNVTLQLYLNGGGSALDQIDNVPGALGSIMESVVSAATSAEHINYTYSVEGLVEVQGHSLKSSDKQAIQILPASGGSTTSQQPQIENFQTQPTVSPEVPVASPNIVNPVIAPTEPTDQVAMPTPQPADPNPIAQPTNQPNTPEPASTPIDLDPPTQSQ